MDFIGSRFHLVVSQISRGDLALQKESKESLTRETEGKQEAGKQRRFCD